MKSRGALRTFYEYGLGSPGVEAHVGCDIDLAFELEDPRGSHPDREPQAVRHDLSALTGFHVRDLYLRSDQPDG